MRPLITRSLSILVLLTSATHAAPTEWNGVREAADTLPRLHALLVLHHGEPVIEHVRRGPGLDRPAPLKSLSKTLLSAVAGIVRGHAGALHVQSRLGRGTTFTILLPACRSAPTLPPPRVETTFKREGSTVLVVDDEAGVRALARDALAQGGYTVHTAEGGEEALALFDGAEGAIDLVLLDMTMPTMSGVDVLEALRARGSDALVLLSSGYSEVDSVGGLGAARPDGFLQKPYRAADLLGRLDTMLAARTRRTQASRVRGHEGAV